MNFLSRLLCRKPPPEDRRNMNEDWRVGDLAVCVRDDWTSPWPSDPKAGELNVVRFIREGIATGNYRIFSLGFVDKPEALGWDTIAFRKIRPDHKAEESEISRQIRACRREREGV